MCNLIIIIKSEVWIIKSRSEMMILQYMHTQFTKYIVCHVFVKLYDKIR